MNRDKTITEKVFLFTNEKLSFLTLFIISILSGASYFYQYEIADSKQTSFIFFSEFIKTAAIVLLFFSTRHKYLVSRMFGWRVLHWASYICIAGRIGEQAMQFSPALRDFLQIDAYSLYFPTYVLGFIGFAAVGLANYQTLERLKVLAHCFTLTACFTFITSVIIIAIDSNQTNNSALVITTHLDVLILALTFSLSFYSGFDKTIMPFTAAFSIIAVGDIFFFTTASKFAIITNPIVHYFTIVFYFGMLAFAKQSETRAADIKRVKGENVMLTCIECFALSCIIGALTWFLIHQQIPLELFLPLNGIFIILLASEFLSYLHNKALMKARENSMRAVIKSSERFRVVFENSPTSLILLDLSGDIVHTNKTFSEFCGLEQDQVLGHSIGHVIHPDDRSLFDINLAKVLGSDTTSSISIECRFLRVDGEVRWGSTSINHIPSSSFSDEVNADFVIQIEDITNKKIHETELVTMANRDPLTGLWNRAYLSNLITKVLESNESDSEKADADALRISETYQTFAVFFLDLDRFKVINDTLGHAAGDIVLQTTGERLSHIVGTRGEVARLGGDEFVILFYPPTTQAIIEIVAEEIKVSVSQPILLSQGETIVTCSVGALMCFGRDLNPGDIMREADAAMYRAKGHGKNFVEIATTKDKNRNYSELKFTNDLRRALTTDQIKVYYQPIVSLSTNEIVGFEALSRWEHPKKGLISPDEFIPLAEDTGLILEIGYYMMEQAFKQLSIWQKTYIPSSGKPLSMNVNLSVSQLRDPKLFRQIEEVKRQSNCAVNSMIFEITESAVMGDAKHAIALLHEIRDLGFRLRIDDFGTGYSSLSYLKKMPIDGFKIDKSFVDGLDIDENDTAIVHALLGLAHAMNLTVTAEGIEFDRQRNSLKELNCDYGQGYLFSEAVPAHEVVLRSNVGDAVDFAKPEKADRDSA